MTISFFHIRVKNNVPHLLTPPYFENRQVTAEKVVSKGVTINYALTYIYFSERSSRVGNDYFSPAQSLNISRQTEKQSLVCVSKWPASPVAGY